MVIDTQDMRADEYVSSIPPEAAHAASEFEDTAPAHDTGMEMLGGLIAIAGGIALGGVCIGFILAVVFR